MGRTDESGGTFELRLPTKRILESQIGVEVDDTVRGVELNNGPFGYGPFVT